LLPKGLKSITAIKGRIFHHLSLRGFNFLDERFQSFVPRKLEALERKFIRQVHQPAVGATSVANSVGRCGLCDRLVVVNLQLKEKTACSVSPCERWSFNIRRGQAPMLPLTLTLSLTFCPTPERFLEGFEMSRNFAVGQEPDPPKITTRHSPSFRLGKNLALPILFLSIVPRPSSR